MARKADGTAERAWRERLKRWVASSGTLAEFCGAEGVSLPSFYQWRRKLWGRCEGRRRADRQPAPGPVFVAVEVVDALDAVVDALDAVAAASEVVSDATAEGATSDLRDGDQTAECGRFVGIDSLTSLIEVELPTGVRIRIGAEIDAGRLADVLRAILGACEC
jgi:hypothetical protein